MVQETGIDRAVRKAVSRYRRMRAGLVVGAVTTEGERALGAAGRTRNPDGPAPTEGTLFRLGRTTRVVTGLLLAEAVRRGEVELETPVGDLLPEVGRPALGGVEVTVEHLATETSGLAELPVSAWRTAWADLRARPGDPYAGVDRAALLAAVAGAAPLRTPGTGGVRPSDVGAGLLGHALVAAAGAADYGALVRERVCDPLGLADTVLVPDRDQVAREARGHTTRGRPVAAWEYAGLPGAGALRSTAADLLTFLHAQLRPGDPPLGPAMALTHADRRPGGTWGAGLGWLCRRGRDAEDPLLFTTGTGAGGYGSFVGLRPAAGVGAVVLVNDANPPVADGLQLLGALAP